VVITIKIWAADARFRPFCPGLDHQLVKSRRKRVILIDVTTGW